MRRCRVGTLVIVAALAMGASACRKTTVKGQIDVPGNDVRNIAVRVIPEKEIKPYLDNKVVQALVALDERRTAFERSGREADAATRDYQIASSGVGAVTSTQGGVTITADKDSSGGHWYSYDAKQHTQAEAEAQARANLEEASRQRASNAAQFAADKPRLADSMAAGRLSHEDARARLLAWETDMLADLPEKGTVVYTDEKGRFTAKVPRGDKVAVFAMGDFKIGGTLQHRAWGLWVKADTAEKPLRLGTNDLLLEQPRDSVLK